MKIGDRAGTIRGEPGMLSAEMDGNGETRYGAASSVLVASDTTIGRGSIDTAIACLDARVLEVVSIAAAQDRLDRTISLSAVVVHAGDESGEALEALVARLDALSAEGVCGALVIVPPAKIDAVFAHLDGGDVHVLSDPDESDIIAALAMACTRRPYRLNDVAGDTGVNRLALLSEEVGRIARTLASLAENAPRPARLDPAMFEPIPPMTADVAGAGAARVRALIRARRTRDQFFRSELFADPAWDMLLDLMAARLEHKRVSVSSLCIAAAVPATTALRWIKTMTDEGLFVRRADNNDGRRIFIELSERSAAAMHSYLDWLKVNALAMV